MLKMVPSKYFIGIVLISISIKILLIPSYTSTDFEVHRNWLAITYHLPVKEWYYEKTSEWTLDYPPFFAWFEKGLSSVAVHFDPEIVNITNLNYKSDETLLFQRGSVIVTDLVLAYAGYKCCCSTNLLNFEVKQKLVFFILLILNCGLFIVDHIHFQYNGFLFGILFLAISNILQNSFYAGAFWFAVLLNFKHIFLYVAPAFGIFYLRMYCITSLKNLNDILCSIKIKRTFFLAVIVLSVFTISFGPFIQDLNQVILRLFPFKRGLTHAYWAPNFWALYNGVDRVLALIGKRFKLLSHSNVASSTGGMVQTVEHVVLPPVFPIVTFFMTFWSMVPCLFHIFFKPKKEFHDFLNQFLRSIVICSLSSFLFGWHVHEKAILMAVLPLTLLALSGTKRDARVFLLLQTVGHYSLFPLLFQPFETVLKICLLLIYSTIAFSTLGYIYQCKNKLLSCLNVFESIYLIGIFIVEILCNIIFPIFHVTQHYAFLPLLIISMYSAFGICWGWVLLYYHTLTC